MMTMTMRMVGMGKRWLLAFDSYARSKWFPFGSGLSGRNCSWLLLLPTAVSDRIKPAGASTPIRPCGESADSQAHGVILEARLGKQGREARPWDSAAHATIHKSGANPAIIRSAPSMSLAGLTTKCIFSFSPCRHSDIQTQITKSILGCISIFGRKKTAWRHYSE
ncbi:hypothetical protein GGI43DRAFT_83501 [Trichoderma evansii]